jgi:uncharacterized protein YyaL (SSP411 family)
LQDNATPSGSSLAADALLRLAAFTGRGEYEDAARAAVSLVVPALRKYPTAFGRWLSVADALQDGFKQVAVVYQDGQDVRPLLEAVKSQFRPDIVVAAGATPPSPSAPALLTDRPLKEGQPTAYVCESFVCKLPVNSAMELEAELKR